MFAQFHAAQQATAQQAAGPQEEKKGKDTTLGMADEEIQDLLEMCGKSKQASFVDLPQWFHLCAKKGKESFKITVIKQTITNTYFYKDAKVLLTHPLLKIALKHSWSGKEGGTHPSIMQLKDYHHSVYWNCPWMKLQP